MRVALRGASWAAPAVCAAAALLSVAPAAAQDEVAAVEALRKGDLTEAKAQLGQAVRRNPADYDAVLFYASTLPPKEALRIADSLSRAPNAQGWARARGLRFAGDHLFLKEDYKKAADAYMQASKFDAASIYRHFYALSMAMDGQTEAARAVWNGIALDKADELSGEAARLLSHLPKPAVTEAATVNQQAAAPPPVNPPVAPVNQQIKADEAKIPPAPAAAPVNPPVAPVNQQIKVDEAKTPPTPAAPVNPPVAPVNQQIKVDEAKTPPTPAAPANPPVAPVNQQNDTQGRTATPLIPPNNTAASTTANPKPTGPVFTIQVGAFASKENADNLVKRLTGKYEDITISTTGSGDQTLYRVRVGSFQKKEDAVAFADKLIIEAGLSARVMEK